MNLEIVLSVATGVLAAIGAAAAVMMLRRCRRLEVSPRVLVAVLVAALCAWCMESAIHLQASPWQALVMLIAASHTLHVVRARRPLLRASDLNPFA